LNPKEQLKEMLDKFNKPYNNENVVKLVERLLEWSELEMVQIEDITNYLISNNANLICNYSQDDVSRVDTLIEGRIQSI
jgi:hypothetical protein